MEEKNINIETDKIVKVTIVDHDWDDNSSYPGGVLGTYFLVNPNSEKLEMLKSMIETRFDCDDDASDEEIKAKEFLCDHIWEEIEKFIKENFVSVSITEKFEISY